MHILSNLLERYLRMAPPDGAARRALSESIKELMNIDISPRAIKMINGVAFIDVDPTIKSALFMRHDELIRLVEARLGAKTLIGVR